MDSATIPASSRHLCVACVAAADSADSTSCSGRCERRSSHAQTTHLTTLRSPKRLFQSFRRRMRLPVHRSFVSEIPSTARPGFLIPNNVFGSLSRRPLTSSMEAPIGWTTTQMWRFPGPPRASWLQTSLILVSHFSFFFRPVIFQQTRAHIRSDLLHLDTAPKCCAANHLQP